MRRDASRGRKSKAEGGGNQRLWNYIHLCLYGFLSLYSLHVLISTGGINEDLKKIRRTARFKEDSKDSTTRFSLEASFSSVQQHATFVLLPPPHGRGGIGKSFTCMRLCNRYVSPSFHLYALKKKKV